MGALLGQWGFLDNLDDTSGNGHHGTFTPGSGGSLTYVAGPQPNTRGVQFSHDQDSISYGRTGLEAIADGTTVMGWMKVTGNPNFLLGLISKARVSASSRLRLGMQGAAHNPAYAARWKDDLHNNEAVTPILDSGWHHYTLVDGNTKWALYIDGTIAVSHNGTRAMNNSTSPTWEAFNWISGYNATITDQWAYSGMSVSGVRIFQGELTTTEVVTWMNTPVMAVPLSGSGTLSATTVQVAPVPADLSGSGSLTVTVTASYPSAAGLSGSGSLSATTVKVAPAAASLSGSGSLTATTTESYTRTAGLDGSGTLSATVVKVAVISASFGGSGVTAITSFAAYSKTISLDGVGVLSATVVKVSVISLAGSGVLSATIFLSCPITLPFSGEGALSATSSELVSTELVSTDRIEIGDDTISTFDFYVGDERVQAIYAGDVLVWWHIETALAELASGGSLTSTVWVTYQQSIAFSGGATLSATAKRLVLVAAELAGGGSLSAVAMQQFAYAASLSGVGGLSATVEFIVYGPSQRMFSNTAPALSASGNFTLGCYFVTNAPGRITHIRAWVEGGTHIYSLWDAYGGAKLGTATNTSTGPPAWREVALPVPVEVAAGINLVATYSTDNLTYGYSNVNPTSLTPDLTFGDARYNLGGPDLLPDTIAAGAHFHADVVFQKALRNSSVINVIFLGDGTLSATVNKAIPANFSGGGTLSATVVKVAPVIASLSGIGTLSATAVPVWTPKSISGLGLWLDAGTLGLADGASVTSWADISGLGRNATAEGTPPTYSAAGINGHPAVNFDGIYAYGRRMVVSGWAAALASKTQYTLFMVETPRQFDYRVIMGAPLWTSDWQWLLEHQSGSNGGYYWGHGANAYRQVTAGMTLNTPTLWTLLHNNLTNTHSYQNGTEKFPESYGPSGDMYATVPNYAAMGDNAYFGAYFDGTYPIDSLIGELIWYDHALTDAERLAVEGYLKAKWNL